MSLPFRTSTDLHGDGRYQWIELGWALLVLLAISTVAAGGGLLGLIIERPKAIFLILLTMIIWSIGGWLVGGWRLVLAGLAALTAALAASNRDYILSAALSGLLFVFLSAHLNIVDQQK